MSSEVVLSLRGIGKSFPTVDKPYKRLAQVLLPGLAPGGEFHALQGVDLEVRRGEAVGIIGRNGSGKSTLLQVIAGILQPTTGTLKVSARIAALLELGAGFNPEFTGRENIRLNASLLGLDARQIDQRMDSIIGFAEIGDHVDQQVKTYSSGMFVRLAFAVAVHTDPDVLIVDEALSVGDIYFQRKCHRRIEELRQQGCTLLFVTHAIDSLLRLCDRGVVIEAGRVLYDGEVGQAVKEYLRLVFGDNSTGGAEADDERADAPTVAGDGAGDITDGADDELAAFLRGGGQDRFARRAGYNRDETRVGTGEAVTCDYLVTGSHGHGPLVAAREPFTVRVRYLLPAALDNLVFGVRLCTISGTVLYSCNTMVSSGCLYEAEAGTVAVAAFDMRCSLLRGHYFLTVGVSRYDPSSNEYVALDRRVDAIVLTVTGLDTHAEGVTDLEAAIAMSAAGAGAIGVMQ
ncbi:ABC transporter ATP-binding protein [Luteimonas sp. MJ204]|uniref:ABC transporter ATP-binding protein n=1 Tax=Luteimonas sp. MJ145 TaxID=3129234 RepID=UPI0031BB97C0